MKTSNVGHHLKIQCSSFVLVEKQRPINLIVLPDFQFYFISFPVTASNFSFPSKFPFDFEALFP